MKLTRPPFILAHPGDASGCGYHRVIRPMEILSRNGLCAARVESSFLSEQGLAAVNPDIVLFQRQTDDVHVELMEKYRRILPDATFVFEIDDALSAVPEKSWHEPFMTPNIDSKIRKAVAQCDVVVTSTEDLSEYMRKICEPGTVIRTVPNMLGKDDLETAQKIRKESPVKREDRLRIGWGGGIGHAGDLALLTEVFTALKDEVEWVFIGMNPDVPEGTRKVFGGATEPRRYLASLAAINVDLIVAPLEDHLFNRCKSNLRLIEAGACSYPVIASPVAPYETDRPPVYAYCRTAQDWIDAIRDFAALSTDEQHNWGARMYDWVRGRYILDDHGEKRLSAMLPANVRPFRPRLSDKRASGLTIVSSAPIPDIDDLEFDIETACDTYSTDILYVRPGTHLTQSMVERICAAEGDVICTLTNDGGPWGFPETRVFSALTPETASTIDRLCSASTEIVPLAAVTGPCVLLRRKALQAIGSPDFSSLDTELAILEWSVTARCRGLVVGAFLGAYVATDKPLVHSNEQSNIVAQRIQLRWPPYNADESRLRAYRESLELSFHRDAYTVLPPSMKPDYSAWASMCDEPGPGTLALAANSAWGEEAVARHGIVSTDHPSFSTIDSDDKLPAHTRWILLSPENAALSPLALYHIAHAVEEHGNNSTLFYGDHDFLNPTGLRIGPDLKPNFDLHLFLGRDYLTQALVVSTKLLPLWYETRAEHPDAPADCQLYAFILKAIEKHGRRTIHHIPRILTHLQPESMPLVVAASKIKAAIGQTFTTRMGWNVTVHHHSLLPPYRDLSYAPGVELYQPKVSIIIPCKNNLEMLAPCVATVLKMTAYKNFEIVIVDNGSTRQEMLDYQASLDDSRITLVRWNHEFNWSKLNNYAVRNHASGEFLCFLNDDTRVLAPEWLNEMVGAALVPGVGSVGARLLYPTGAIQHIGVVADGGMSGHMHKWLPSGHPGVNGIAMLAHEATAATGACLVVKREIFDELGGFEERLAHNFNDVAFGRELMRRGYVNIISTRAELQHFEGVTRSPVFDDDAMMKIQRDGKIIMSLYPEHDPYWNPNLVFSAHMNGRAIDGMDLNTFIFPSPPAPWGTLPQARALVIGPLTGIVDEQRDGYSIYALEISNFSARISSPPMVNTGPWDLRHPAATAAALKQLDIAKVIITQLGDHPLQTLFFAKRLGVPVTYRPLNAEAVCPRGDLKQDGKSCDSGYARPGACQSCLEEFGSQHGNIGIISWRSEWMRFLMSNVEVDLSSLDASPEYRKALSDVFYGSTEESEAA